MPKEYGTPGPRAIYPDICTSRSIAACDIESQLVFDRLIAQSDDQGRVEGDVPILKTLCVPLVDRISTRNLGRFLAELEAEDLIFRYESGRSSLTQIPTWWRWQQGMRRAYPSRWPAPEGWTDAVYGLGEGYQASYKAWLIAAERGTAPHNAAFRGDLRHNGALALAHERAAAGAAGAGLGAPPAAPALSGALSVPDSPNPAQRGSGSRENGTNPRAQGTNPRAVAARTETERDEAAKARRWRSSQRHQAYLRDAISAAEQADMDHRDAPLAEIPDFAEHEATVAAEMAR